MNERERVAWDLASLKARCDAGPMQESTELGRGGMDTLRAAKPMAELRRDAEFVASRFSVKLEDL